MNFVRIFDWHVLLVTAFACAATYLCIDNEIAADLPTSLIAVAIVFPIVFSINAAYTRREEALGYLGLVRATIASLYLAHRDWVGAPETHGPRAAKIGRKLYASICEALAADKQDQPTARLKVRACFSAFFTLYRGFAGRRPVIHRGVARQQLPQPCNYRLREAPRHFGLPHTGVTARLFQGYLNIFPMLFAPLYASIAATAGAPFGYAMAVAFAFVLVGLDNIQDALENPFDGIGVDDVDLEADGELYWLPEDKPHTRALD